MEKKLIFEETHRLLFYGLMFFLYFSVFFMLFLRKSHEKIAFYRTFDSNLCLSRINLYILIGYHFLSMTSAFIQAFICTIPPKSNYLNMMSNFLFIALVFPISATVTVGFCNACLFYGEFLCPKVNGEKMRCWQNYIIHILPLPAALLDFIFTRHYYNHSQIAGCLPTVVFVTVYFLWIWFDSRIRGAWIYPLLGSLGPFQRVFIMLFVVAFTAALYKPGKNMNLIIWGWSYY